jgi:hypothetical protein
MLVPQRTERGAPVSVAVFEPYRGFVVGQRLYCGGPMSWRLPAVLRSNGEARRE